MDVSKFFIRQNTLTAKQINIPIQLDWDYLGLEQSVDEYEKEVITEVIGIGRDFEIDRFANAPFTGTSQETAIKYQFYFYSGGTLTNPLNWRLDYRSEGFTTGNIYYYDNNFANSFFKLDLYDSTDDKKQKNYITIIIPTQQGLKKDAILQRQPVTIKMPDFVLDYIGDKEGFFLYENKNTQEVLIIPVVMNEKNKQIIEDAFLWMREVWDNFKDGDLPMKPEGATKTKMPCTYCPIKKECYSKDTPVGTVQIELFAVPKV